MGPCAKRKVWEIESDHMRVTDEEKEVQGNMKDLVEAQLSAFVLHSGCSTLTQGVFLSHSSRSAAGESSSLHSLSCLEKCLLTRKLHFISNLLQLCAAAGMLATGGVWQKCIP